MRDSIKSSIMRVAKIGFDFSAPTDEENYHVSGDTARTTGTEVGPFTFAVGTTDKVTIKIGAGSNQAITLPDGQQTTQDVVDYINANTTDLTAVVDSGGRLKMYANTVTDDLEIVAVANDAYSVLGLTEGIYSAVKTAVLLIQWTNFRESAEGLEIFAGGAEGQEERYAIFFREYLEASGIQEIKPNDWFELEGVRWDLCVDEPIIVGTGPSGGTNPEVRVLLRRASELENSVNVKTMGVDL